MVGLLDKFMLVLIDGNISSQSAGGQNQCRVESVMSELSLLGAGHVTFQTEFLQGNVESSFIIYSCYYGLLSLTSSMNPRMLSQYQQRVVTKPKETCILTQVV